MSGEETQRIRQQADTPLEGSQFAQELTGNILPFWPEHAVDRTHGGFHGAVTNDLTIRDDVPRSAVLCARILWTYSAAYRRLGDPKHLETAEWAYDDLTRTFWDDEFGGVFWQVDRRGTPVSDRKHHYAQAFAIYGLTEYHRATGESRSLEAAHGLFDLLEEHGYDTVHGGYLDGSGRAWEPPEDARLSNQEPFCRKSMNTMLHILEAYTNLLRVCPDERLRVRHRALIDTFLQRILDPQFGHFRLFFDDAWRSLAEGASFGHDIEGSWLLCEAADLHGDADLSERVRIAALRLAGTAHREGLDTDGSLFSERAADGAMCPNKDWWPQAEAMVGFYNAFQLSGERQFALDAKRVWDYIRATLIDRTDGEWFKRVDRVGSPDPSSDKAGPWHGPYHHARACFEMIDRLAEPG